MQSNHIILKICHLSQSLNNNLILKDVNLNFQSGKIYGLVGTNGSGKTTLMKSILGLNYVDSGQIIFNEINIENGQHEIQRAQIGSLIEEPLFPNNYTVQQVLAEQQALLKVKVTRNYLDKLLLLLGLNRKLETKVKNLSLGWRKKLGILRAICNFPQLLLLDEPFNGLDLLSVHQVEEILTFLAQQNTCIVIASHLIQQLQELGAELYWVKNQQISLLRRADKRLADY